MFSTTHLFFRENPPAAIDTVTEEALKTSLGREAYYRFLINHPHIPPARKLFGLSAPAEVETKKIKNQTKRILLYVHPDKVDSGEKAQCTEIAQLVTKAREDAITSQAVFAFGASDYLISPDHTRFITGCIQDEKWTWAKDRIPKINIQDLKDQKHLGMLCILVLVRTNNLKEAIECSEIVGEQTIKEILVRCQNSIIKFQTPPFDLADVQNLFKSADDEMVVLQRIFEDRLGKGWWSSPIIPHSLHSALKNYYGVINSPVMYEMHLRRAIRQCSHVHIEEKKRLIGELSCWVQSKYGHVDFSADKIDVNTLCRVLKQEFQQINLSISKSIADVLEFPDRLKTQQADSICQTLDEIIEKEDGYNSYIAPWVPALMASWVPQYFKESTGHCLAYSDTEINKIRSLAPFLKGLKAYQRGDARLAASYFSEAKAYFLLGLLQIEFREYKKAAKSFEKLINDSLTPQDKLLKHLLLAMNLHDLTYSETPPVSESGSFGLSDEVEKQVIIGMQNR